LTSSRAVGRTLLARLSLTNNGKSYFQGIDRPRWVLRSIRRSHEWTCRAVESFLWPDPKGISRWRPDLRRFFLRDLYGYFSICYQIIWYYMTSDVMSSSDITRHLSCIISLTDFFSRTSAKGVGSRWQKRNG
jgi:hypothetical protein